MLIVSNTVKFARREGNEQGLMEEQMTGNIDWGDG